MALPWEKDPVEDEATAPAPGGLRLLVPTVRQPTPQTDAQARKDALDVINTEGTIADRPLARQAREAEIRDKDINNESSLRKEFRALESVKALDLALPSWKAATKAADNPVGDMQIITAWVKAYDPQGAIMQGDVQTAEQAQSVVQKLGGQANAMFGGDGRLLPEVRKNFLAETHRRLAARADQYRLERQNYLEIAQRTPGVNPLNVVGREPYEGLGVTEAEFLGYYPGKQGEPKIPYVPGLTKEQAAARMGAPDGGGPGGGIGEDERIRWGGAGPQPPTSLNPQQEAALQRFYSQFKPGELTLQEYNRFYTSLTGTDPGERGQENVDHFNKYGTFSTAVEQDPYIKEEIARRVEGTDAAGAGVVGAGEALTMGGIGEVAAAGDAVVGALGGEGSFGELYGRNLQVEEGYQDALAERDPVAYHAGQVIAALALPTSITSAARSAATAALRAGAGREAAIQAARSAATRRMAAEGGAYSGAYGFGTGEGDVTDRLANATVSAIVGSAGGAALGKAAPAVADAVGPAAGRVADSLRRTPRAAEPDDLRAAEAARELGIDVPRFVVGGRQDAQAASALEQSNAGGRIISEATTRFLDQAQGAADNIAAGVGQADANLEAVGERAVAAGGRALRGERRRIGTIYTQAERAADNEAVPPTETMQTLKALISNERKVPGGTKLQPVLEHYANAFDQGGPMSIEGARAMRSELGSRLSDEAGLTPTNAERLTNEIMRAVGRDIENGLTAAGKPQAVALYRDADNQWRRQLRLERKVLEPYIGKDGENFGAALASRLTADTQGNGVRAARFLSAIDPDEANNIRASLITRLGRANSGQQNAAGDAFSLDTFLTNWDKIRNSRNLIFPQETVRALNNLAEVADAARRAGRTKNRSNTGGVNWRIWETGAGATGVGITAMTADPKYAAGGAIIMGLSGLRSWNAARLLSNPEFARRLGATPPAPAAARAYWQRPWVEKLSRSQPNLAADIAGFQQGVVNALTLDAPKAVTRAAASGGADADRNQQDERR